MPILIDGHNLIGSGVFEDIQLSDEDDEAKLVARLRVWKSRYRGRITVVFDRGVPGGINRDLSGAGVEVIFAANPAQADDLIRRRLRRATHDLMLVSNDDALVREARRHGVETCNGHEFVARFTLADAPKLGPDVDPDLALGKDEVEEWLRLFGQNKRKRRRKRQRDRPTQTADVKRKRKRSTGKPTSPSRAPRPKRGETTQRPARRKNEGKGTQKS